jgi:hypothetical protein
MRGILTALQLLLFLAAFDSCMCGMATVPAVVELVGPTGKIPTGFNSYSLFLICDQKWLGKDKNADFAALYYEFRNFGDAIGEKDAAVWFWKGDSPSRFRTDGRHVDIRRSKHFCSAWHLPPSEGPYLVAMSTYPDENDLSSELPKENAVFALGKMSSDQIGELLDGLSVEIRKNRPTPIKANSPPAWVSLLAAVQQTINKFGCAWSFKVDAGLVKADLHSCQPGGE